MSGTAFNMASYEKSVFDKNGKEEEMGSDELESRKNVPEDENDDHEDETSALHLGGKLEAANSVSSDSSSPTESSSLGKPKGKDETISYHYICMNNLFYQPSN